MTHHDLPLPNDDNLPTGSIQSRIRSLDADGVAQVLDDERQHADRVQVVHILEHRLESLRNGDVEPSGGDPTAAVPETGAGVPGGSVAPPATEGPKQNPPPHGMPENPSQQPR